MSDRWGPSIDCPACGKAISQIDICSCPVCEATVCKYCKDSHVCLKCAVCQHEIRRGKYLEEYSEWVCGDECHIEFLNQIIHESQQDNLGKLAKKAATTGNLTDLQAYLKERRKYT